MKKTTIDKNTYTFFYFLCNRVKNLIDFDLEILCSYTTVQLMQLIINLGEFKMGCCYYLFLSKSEE